jgi:hypothetical protein
MAQGITKLRQLLTIDFVKENIMPLQGSPLGFLTDQDKGGGYSPEVVRECSIEAMLRGIRVVGNEMNIISGRMYVAKGGAKRLVLEYPGLSNLQMDPGVPYMAGEKGALVPFSATWLLDGKEMKLVCEYVKEGDKVTDTRIPVKVNGGMGSDAIVGKAYRKMYVRIYDRLTGIVLPDADVGDFITTEGMPAPAAPEQDGQRISLKSETKKAPESKAAGQSTREPGQEG